MRKPRCLIFHVVSHILHIAFIKFQYEQRYSEVFVCCIFPVAKLQTLYEMRHT